jgi:hypothetical protein
LAIQNITFDITRINSYCFRVGPEGGKVEEVMGVDGTGIPTEEIVDTFTACPGMVGKLKLFLIQVRFVLFCYMFDKNIVYRIVYENWSNVFGEGCIFCKILLLNFLVFSNITLPSFACLHPSMKVVYRRKTVFFVFHKSNLLIWFRLKKTDILYIFFSGLPRGRISVEGVSADDVDGRRKASGM